MGSCSGCASRSSKGLNNIAGAIEPNKINLNNNSANQENMSLKKSETIAPPVSTDMDHPLAFYTFPRSFSK